MSTLYREPDSAPIGRLPRLRTRVGLVVLLIGLVIFLAGVRPGIFGVHRDPNVGFLQISTFLFGMALICLGGYTVLSGLWFGLERSIAADIGLRLVATGYVISFASGMADMLGFGNHLPPILPYFGFWQALGVIVGEVMIIIGFILMVPWPWRRPSHQEN